MRPIVWLVPFVMAVALVVPLLLPVQAAAEPWDIKAGAGPAYGTSFSSFEKDGLGGQVYFDLGLTEGLHLSLGAHLLSHVVGNGEESSFWHAGIGVSYNLDVLVVVPFLALRLGWLEQNFAASPAQTGPGLLVSLGFDYLITEEFTVGFAAEYHGLLSNFSGFPGLATFCLRTGLRLPAF